MGEGIIIHVYELYVTSPRMQALVSASWAYLIQSLKLSEIIRFMQQAITAKIVEIEGKHRVLENHQLNSFQIN